MTFKITEEMLTPEIKATFPTYIDKWTKIGLSTELSDYEPVVQAVNDMYRVAGLPVPSQVIRLPSLAAAIKHFQELDGSLGAYQIMQAVACAAEEAPVLSFYDVFGTEFNLEVVQRLKPAMELCARVSYLWTFRDAAVYVDKPKVISRDEQGRLHSDTGMAIEFADGTGIYALHGIQVDSHVVMEPSRITVSDIDKETNSEVRRVLLGRMTYERFLKEAGCQLIHRDEFGELYRRRLRDGEPLLLVKVINNTPEIETLVMSAQQQDEYMSKRGDLVRLDGKKGLFKVYVLPVHPDLAPILDDKGTNFGEPQELTAKNAVASTWGMRGEDFNPDFRS